MDVRFYMTEAGTEPVKDYLRPLDLKQRKLVGGVIRMIQNTGTLPASAKSFRPPLFELSIGYHRIFYVLHKGSMYLLHAYQKDQRKAPASEIAKATERMKKILAT